MFTNDWTFYVTCKIAQRVCNLLFATFTKVGHWDANKEDKVNKVVQLNSLKAIDWTGEFWQELQCLVRNKQRHKGIKPLAGRKITVVTIEVDQA